MGVLHWRRLSVEEGRAELFTRMEEVCAHCVMFSYSTRCWKSRLRPVFHGGVLSLYTCAVASQFLGTFCPLRLHLYFQVNVKFTFGLLLRHKNVFHERAGHTALLHGLSQCTVCLFPQRLYTVCFFCSTDNGPGFSLRSVIQDCRDVVQRHISMIRLMVLRQFIH